MLDNLKTVVDRYGNLLDNSNTSVVEYNYQPFGETEILGSKAQELEYQMRLLCDNNLDRVDIQKSAEKITSIVIESVQNQMNKAGESFLSAVVGFASTIVLDTVEFVGGTVCAIGGALQGKSLDEGYRSFSHGVDTVRNFIEDIVPDKEWYAGGKISGTVAEIVYSIANIPNVVKGFSSLSNGMKIASGGEALVVTGTVAESTLAVGVVAGEITKGFALAEKVAGNIQEYSETGNGGNETGKTNGESENKKENLNRFKNEEVFEEHYKKHVIEQQEFGDITKQQYIEKARKLINSKSDKNILTKVRTNGDTIYYDIAQNEFAVKTSEGIIRTFFKPQNGIEYFNSIK